MQSFLRPLSPRSPTSCYRLPRRRPAGLQCQRYAHSARRVPPKPYGQPARRPASTAVHGSESTKRRPGEPFGHVNSAATVTTNGQ